MQGHFLPGCLILLVCSFCPTSSSVYMKDHFVCRVDAEEINEPNKPPNTYILDTVKPNKLAHLVYGKKWP